jgi:hypothetical protein
MRPTFRRVDLSTDVDFMPAADTAPTRKPPHCNSTDAPPGMPSSPGGCHRALEGSGQAHPCISLNV